MNPSLFYVSIIYELSFVSQSGYPEYRPRGHYLLLTAVICQALLGRVNYLQLVMNAHVLCTPPGVIRKCWRWKCGMHVTKQSYKVCWSKCAIHV